MTVLNLLAWVPLAVIVVYAFSFTLAAHFDKKIKSRVFWGETLDSRKNEIEWISLYSGPPHPILPRKIGLGFT